LVVAAFGVVAVCGLTSLLTPSVAAADESVPRRDRRETPVVMAIRRCNNAVVNIHGQKVVRASAAAMMGAEPGRQVNGMGTGVVIDPRGYVVTNFHVVEDVNEVRITMADGSQTTADVIATDVRSDLALLKVVTDRDLEVIPRGTSDDLMVGEPVIAIGNAFGYVHTATEGIISALHRDVPVNESQEYRDLIQTSAGINPGNSGGPLLNINGEIIGVNVAVRVGAQQIAFAIPIDQAIEIVNRMIADHNEQRLGLGLVLDQETVRGEGVRIQEVSANGAGQRSGFLPGDRIIEVDSSPIGDQLEFGLSLIELEPGKTLPFVVQRDGHQISVAVTTSAPSLNNDDAAALAWQVIGVKLQPVPNIAMQRINTRVKQSYRGGLYVTDVRSGSPAETYGLQVGDVLIGLHGWSTASMPELQGIIQKASEQDQLQGKFVIIRSDQPMYGHLKMAEAPAATRR
jgi:serine protease Do